MWLVACALYLILTLWPSSLCHSLLTVGPCEVNREKATFNCSRMNLTSVPQHIWPNVTELDLSGNLLNLVHPKSLKKLWRLNSLTKLNLSGNYLPLLLEQHFYHLPSLEILDLSGCRLAAVEPDVLQNFPRLQKLFLDNNDLKWIQAADRRTDFQLSDRSDEEARTGPRDDKQRHSGDDVIKVIPSPFQRKLLTVITMNTNGSDISSNSTESPGNTPSESWKYLVAVLVIAISLSVLITVGAKCKLFHKYLASYRHSRLSEADGASQCDPAAFDVGFSSNGTSSSGPRLDVVAGDTMEEDDDGFIEDNYIQASERERAEREAEHWQHEEEEEEEDEEMEEIEGFSIG